MSFQEYIAVQRKNLQSALKWDLFGATCPRMNRLYVLSINAVPKDKPDVFGQFLLICHKSFLAAATLIGQAQPDDAGPITRRAIEVIRLAAAIKTNPAITEKWGAYEERPKRWEARRQGEKPERLHVHIPVDNVLVEHLMNHWRMFSDADVHFTPEYFVSLGWEKDDNSVLLKYFEVEQRKLETSIVTLLGTHMTMLRVLDECLGGALSINAEWQKLRDEIFAIGKPYADNLERATLFDAPEDIS